MTDYKLRHALKKTIRNFFDDRGFLEVDTPIIVPCPGTEVYLRYFATEWQNYDQKKRKLWLRSSPELHLKKICALDYDRIYQIGKCFRNSGEYTDWHHPEFTMLEWYRKNQSFPEFLNETEELIKSCREGLSRLNSNVIDISAFTRLSVYEAFEEFCNVRLIDNDQELPEKLNKQNLHSITENDDFESSFFKGILERVEPALKNLGAVILYDFPPSQAALATVENSRAKRAEVYINGHELSNGFLELLNPDENKRRIVDALSKRKSLNFEVPEEDKSFYLAIEKLNEEEKSICGNALGFERLLAILTSQKNIDQVTGFRSQIYSK